jgi:hypothetical protein
MDVYIMLTTEMITLIAEMLQLLITYVAKKISGSVRHFHEKFASQVVT